MRSMIVHGFTAVSFGAVLAMGIITHTQAAAPANYSQACKEVVASGSLSASSVEKAAYARRAVRRTARRTVRRHGY